MESPKIEKWKFNSQHHFFLFRTKSENISLHVTHKQTQRIRLVKRSHKKSCLWKISIPSLSETLSTQCTALCVGRGQPSWLLPQKSYSNRWQSRNKTSLHDNIASTRSEADEKLKQRKPAWKTWQKNRGWNRWKFKSLQNNRIKTTEYFTGFTENNKATGKLYKHHEFWITNKNW